MRNSYKNKNQSNGGGKVQLNESNYQLLNSDPNWLGIKKIVFDFANKILNQNKIQLTQFDITNEAQVIQASGMSSEGYKDLLVQFAQYSKGLMDSYLFPLAPCQFCSMTDEQKNATGRTMLLSLQRDKSWLVNVAGPDSGPDNMMNGGPGCGWEFYACGILCLSLTVPLLFLLCLGLCSCGWCDPKPPFCTGAGVANIGTGTW